ncbi:MAG: glycosyltransferase family 4 protein [Proteobacteria bacterium]|nr:glycosyltransferase family 4 protein [Pseudomonadota bacterium]
MTERDQPSTGRPAAEAGRPVVLQVLPRLVTGGAERGAVDIAVTLAEAGGTSLVASEGGPMEYELKRAGIAHVKLPLASKNPVVMYRNVARLVGLIEAHDVDIVHARSRAPAWSAAAAARRTGRHFVTTFHGAYEFGNALKRRYNAIMVKGERVIANSEFIARHIRETYKVDPARVRVIRRGVDLDRFDPERASAERVIQLANKWRLPDGVPVVMLPGRLTRWKGHRGLIEALTHLRDVELLCVIVGTDERRGAYRAELERLIARHGLGGRVFLPGHCDDMPAAYMLADVVVSASTQPEAFGRVVSEAQAMGCPVVASDHGGAREQVLGNRTAFLFPPGDAAALADMIREALALDSGARERLAAEARAHVKANFDKVHMCAATLALYREILSAAEAAPEGAERRHPAPGGTPAGP